MTLLTEDAPGIVVSVKLFLSSRSKPFKRALGAFLRPWGDR